MAPNISQSHLALLAGRVNDAFHAGRPAWKPNATEIKKALMTILNTDRNFLNKLERMRCTSMTDNLVIELVHSYAPELARASPVGGKGKGKGNKMPTNNTNNNNNKGKGKGKGKDKGQRHRQGHLRQAATVQRNPDVLLLQWSGSTSDRC